MFIHCEVASNGLILGDQSCVVGLESLELLAILSFPGRGEDDRRHLRPGRSSPDLSENIELCAGRQAGRQSRRYSSGGGNEP